VLADGVEVGSWALTAANELSWVTCNVPAGTDVIVVKGGANLTTHLEIHWIVFTGQRTHLAPLAWSRYSDDYIISMVMNPDCDVDTYMGQPVQVPVSYPNQDTPTAMVGAKVAITLPKGGEWTFVLTDEEGEEAVTVEIAGAIGEVFTLDLPTFSSYLMLRAARHILPLASILGLNREVPARLTMQRSMPERAHLNCTTP
jgi:hypothetical protein